MLIKRIASKALLAGVIFGLTVMWGCGKDKNANAGSDSSEQQDQQVEVSKSDQPFFKLSLAQWSLHKMIQDGEMDPVDFAQKASELGFAGIEYVSQLYTDSLDASDDPDLAMQNLLKTLKEKSEQYGVQNVLIMVDEEGDLGVLDDEKRNQSVENHKKWVDAAAYLGCHSIRVNAKGEGTEEEVAAAAVKGLTALASYASAKGINVIVENHGGYSSNGKWLSGVMEKVNLPNCGTLPDFGNFCMTEDYGSINDKECDNAYDIYIGVSELLPYAKGVSAKSYDFDEQGNQPKIDYVKMLQVVKDGGYTGFIGVEYEGDNLGEIQGIEATKKLLMKAASELN